MAKAQPTRSLTPGASAAEPAPAPNWLTPSWFGLGLALLVMGAYPQVLWGLESFVARDYGLFSYPVASFQRACFWQGQLPSWNPFSHCGMPFLAQWNTMPLYPPALIYLLLPLGWGLGLFCLLHLWWAGLGMYWLARGWTGQSLAAAVAGLVFSFNGLTLHLLMWPSHVATWSWMPWVVWAVQRAWQQGGRSWLVGAGLATLQMLAGGPETILFTWLLLLSLWLLELWAGWRTTRARSAEAGPWRTALWRFPLLALGVGGLAAIQLVPFLDLVLHSQREAGFADTRWSMPLSGWANFLVPMAFGRTWGQNLFYQVGQYWTSSYYVGAATVLLSLMALGQLRQRRVGWLLGAALLSLLCAFGEQTFVLRTLRQLFPVLTLMTYPVKFVLVIVFSLPLLAAVVLSRWESAPPSQAAQQQRWLLGLSALLLATMAAILWWAGSGLKAQDWQTLWHNALGRALWLVALVCALVMWKRARRAQARQLLGVLLLLGLWVDLRTHQPEQNPTVPLELYTPGLVRTELAMEPAPSIAGPRVLLSPSANGLLDTTRSTHYQEGYLARRLGYFSNCNLLDEVPKINGFFSLLPRETDGLTGLFYVFTNLDLTALQDFLSVGYRTAPGEVTQWQARTNFMPLATAGQQPEFLDDTNTVFRMMRADFEPRQRVFLPEAARGQLAVTHTTQARVLSQRFELQQANLEVEAAEPSMVVIAQSFYHHWRAYVDGQPVRLWRANLGCQALQVPAGRHQVRLAYEDRGLRLGATISALSLAGCVAGAFSMRRRSR